MQTQIIDGRQLAAELRQKLATEVQSLPFTPYLVALLVGDDPASTIYVSNKLKAAKEVGIQASSVTLPSSTQQGDLIRILHGLRAEEEFDGILVQLPLPNHIDKSAILECIDPLKDVDCFSPENVGRMMTGTSDFGPCTPKGIMRLLDAAKVSLPGKKVLVIGCSNIVGRPTATLLSQAGATVTMAHKQTKQLAAEIRRAEVIITAAGCPDLVRGTDLQQGAVVIDVGINRLPDGKIVGDAAFEECLGIAGAITPVPGGVGPMTVACLLENTVRLAKSRRDRGRDDQ